MATPAVVQFEITSKDSAAVQCFYASLFGWEMVQTSIPGYGRVRAGEKGITGAIGAGGNGGAGQVTVFAEVDNLQETLSRVEELGGTVIGAPRELPQTDSTVAFVADPEGHVVGLSQGLQRANEIYRSLRASHARRG
jgi:predicted enzyme related to lactoylglutathione lyase